MPYANAQQPYAMPQPYAMLPPQPQPYALPQPYANASAFGGSLRDGGPPQYANAQQQYGVQQLYSPHPAILNSDDKFGTTSVIMPILCCGGCY